MKKFIDGDYMCFAYDDFVNLQESPAVFVSTSDVNVQAIIRDGLYAASGEFLVNVRQQLAAQQKDALDGETTCLDCGGEVGHRINCPNGIAFSSPPVI